MESIHRIEEPYTAWEVAMTIKQGYYLMFYLLNEIYFEDMENVNDTLGGMLGAMSPDLFVGGVSADPAYWEDWKEIVSRLGISEPLDVKQALQITVAFLEFYRKEFDFDLREIEDRIENMDESDETLKQCIRWAMGI